MNRFCFPPVKTLRLMLSLAVLLWLYPSNLYAQYPDLRPAWDRDFGGNIWEDLHAIEETSDGGYILAGFSSSSNNGDVTQTTRGAGDFWVVKTDDEGFMEWNRRYGGMQMEQAWAIKQTLDGGYFVGGWSDSNIGGEKSANSRGYLDYWVVRIDANGDYLWDVTYGGDSTEFLYDLEITPDGGFIIGGMSYSGISGEKTQANRGDMDLWVVKADANGTLQWERTYGGNGEDRLNEIIIDTDGNFLLGGGTRSDIGNEVAFSNYGVKDFWLLKISQINGDTIWTRRYGGDDEDEIISLTLTSDDGFLLGGSSRSNPGFDKTEPAEGITDMWVVKTDRSGNILWDRTFGGPALESCYAVKENSIGYYLIGGYSGSDAGIHKTENSRGGLDYWLIYLDPNGNKQWDQTLGGDRDDVLENLFQTSDGGYMLAGHSQSGPSGDKTSNNKGLNDYWIIKTDCALVLDLADTVACPNQEFSLNAYDSQCISCSWQWNDSNIDSVRIILPTTDVTYSVTLTDGVGCARSDEINLRVLTPPVVDLGADQIICPGDSIILDAENPGFDFQWSSNDSTQFIIVDTSNTYAVTVTDINGCYTEDSVSVQLGNPPIIDLGSDTTVCTNESIVLDAGFFPAADYRWTPSGNSQMQDVFDPGVYSVVVTDNNGCTGTDTIEVDQYSIPIIFNLRTTCDERNTKYVVQFEIFGGDSMSYIVTGMPGSLNGRLFTSDSIPKDAPYNFSVSDGRACLPLNISDTYDCDCQTQVGTLQNVSYSTCGDEAVYIQVDVSSQPDQNDTTVYILHDGDAQNIGVILEESSNRRFRFIPGVMNYGEVYYVSMVVGNSTGNSIDYRDGCLARSEGVPVTFYPQPVASILPLGPTSITCDNNSVVLDGSSSIPRGSLLFDWSSENGGNIIGNENGPQAEVNAAADYILTIQSQQSGCLDTAVYKVEQDQSVPIVKIELPKKITCIDTILELDARASSSGANFTNSWSGPGLLSGDTTLLARINEPGLYTLIITNTTNSCPTTRTVTVEADTLLPLVNAGTIEYLDCLTEQVSLEGQVITQGLGIFEWSSNDGNFLGPQNILNPSVDQAGTYRLEVMDLKNGCLNWDEVKVVDNPDVPSGATLGIHSPKCFGEANGEILLSDINGGTPPLLTSFNNQPFSNQRIFSGLRSGSYPLKVQDVNGCEWDTIINLIDPPILIVDMGPGMEVEFGDSVLLIPFVNQPLQTFSWSPIDYLSQPDSLITYARPIQSTNFILTVTDTLGCTISELIQLKVDIQRRVYIPNVFSPNFDGKNDGFTVFGGKGVEQVKLLRIFDRWGAQVFERRDFKPNIPSLGWNGIYQHDQVNPGVYIYMSLISFSDGTEIMYQGDVTIIK